MSQKFEAVVVTNGHTPFVEQTLRAVREQTLRPSSVTLVDISTEGQGRALADEYEFSYLHFSRAVNFGDAVNHYLSKDGITNSENKVTSDSQNCESWLWLLHDDSSPAPTCLQELVAQAQRGPTIGAIGPKIRDWFNPDRLLELGIRATRSARRHDNIRGEVDQGQHDLVQDVLAVSTAGMLLRKELWNKLKGTDLALGPFGESLEFGRRIHLAGYRVVVAPQALIFHAEASYRALRNLPLADLPIPAPARFCTTVSEDTNQKLVSGDTEVILPPEIDNPHAENQEASFAPWKPVGNPAESFAARRTAQLYNWLLAASTWQLPFLIFFFPFLQLGRALVRLATRSAYLAGAELKAMLVLLLKPVKLLRARRAIASTSRTNRETLSRLEVKPSLLRQARSLERKIARSDNAPTEVLEPVAASGLRVRRHRAQAGFAILAFVVTGVILSYFAGRFGGWSGGSYSSLPDSFSAFWAYAWSSWIPVGLGYAAAPDPLLGLLSVFFAPLAMLGVSPSSALLWLVILSPALSMIGAWKASGTLTRSIPLRIFGTSLWISLPAYWLSIFSGRVSTIVVATALPYVLWGMVRGSQRHRAEVILGARGRLGVRSRGHAPRYIALSAIALIFVVSAVPALAVTAILIVFAGFLLLPVKKWWALFIPIPALLFVSPFLIQAYNRDSLPAILGTIDIPVAFTQPQPWKILLGLPEDIPFNNWGIWFFVTVSLMVCLAAFIPLLRIKSARSWFAFGSWIFGLGTIALALYLSTISIAVDSNEVVKIWLGPYLLIAYALLLAAAVGGLDRLTAMEIGLRKSSRAVKSFFSFCGIIVASISLLLPLGATRLPTEARGSSQIVAGAAQTLPASAKIAANSGTRSRVLLISQEENQSLRLQIRHFGEATYLEHNALIDYANLKARETNAAPIGYGIGLLENIATLASGNLPADIPQELSRRGIGQLVLSGQGDYLTQISTQLNRVHGLEPLGKIKDSQVWRIAQPVSTTGQVAMRASLEAGEEIYYLPSASLKVSANLPVLRGKVRLAENTDSGWKATLDGISLKNLNENFQTYETTRGGKLNIWWSQWWLWPWRVSCWVILGLLASLLCFSRGEGKR
ncbi:glycosyltransferase [Actinomycetaceae bacterium TAE3-ERU4]|nr:glycosyltransferase [Actinomycetaceae bacterium TAE3-ERU4]